MHHLHKALLLFLAKAAVTLLHAQENLSYSFGFDTSSGHPAMIVKLDFQGNHSGLTSLKLPDSWASQKQLFRAVKDLRAEGILLMDETPDSSVRILKHKPKAAISVSYRLEQDWKGVLEHPLNYRAIIQPHYFQVTGNGLFVKPLLPKETELDLRLNWNNMPDGWQIANSFHCSGRSFAGRLKMEQLENSILVGGDFRLHQVSVEGHPVHVAIRGNEWKFNDTSFVRLAGRIIAAERKFWNDFSEPYYFISLAPYGAPGHYNGSSLHQSFLMNMGSEFGIDVHVYKLLAHEYFHKWLGIKILMQGVEEENAWFSEGFTEYYTWKILNKSGIISFGDFLQATNKTISDYYLSPVRDASIKEMGKQFWANRNFHQLPYNKGFVYTLFLDGFIAKQTGGKRSLDDVMFLLNADAANGVSITEAHVLEVVRNISGSNISKEHFDMIHNGEIIPVWNDVLGRQAELEEKSMGNFELGFDIEASAAAKKITEVRPGSAAFAAGLRTGQSLAGWSIHYDDPSKPAEIRIRDEKGEMKTISYVPVSKEKILIPQFRLK